MIRRARRHVLVLAALAVLAAVAPAAAGAGPVAVFWTFHRSANTASTLTGTAQDTGDGSIVTQRSWRAGSGQNTNACDSAAYDGVGGWLPGGWYTLLGHWDHYDGSKIKGRVWYWEDKRCNGGTGTLRTELFTHSEETVDDGQYCPSGYDDPFCWEGWTDYYSNGCIKLAHALPYPSDVAQADNLWDGYDGHSGSLWLARRLYVS
jgi:hypothetical protein